MHRGSWKRDNWCRPASSAQVRLLAEMAGERGLTLAAVLADVLGDARAEHVESKDVDRVMSFLYTIDVRR